MLLGVNSVLFLRERKDYDDIEEGSLEEMR